MTEELSKGNHFETHSDVGGAWGAAYAVGTPICALITGICCALAVEYFQGFPRDCARIRASVIVVIATTVVGLFLAMDLTYLRLVKNQTPPGGFGDIPWQDDAVALICGVCQLICSAYFAYSAYSVATRKRLLVAWCGLLMATIFLSAFFRAIIGLAPTDWFDGAVLCPRMTFLWLIGSLLLDFSIAVTILSHLRRPARDNRPDGPHLSPQHSRPPDRMQRQHSHAAPTIDLPSIIGPPRAPLLSRLLTTILTSFSLTAILMFSLLLLVLAMHGTEFDPRLPKATGIFTALRLLTTPTYAVTFLYTLNRRKYNYAQPTQPGPRDFEMQLVSPPEPGNWPTFFTSNPGDRRDSRSKTIISGWTSLRRPPFRRASAPLPPPIHAADGQPDSIYHTKRPPFDFLYPTVNGSIIFQF